MNSAVSHSLDIPKISPQSVRWRHWVLRDEWRSHGPLFALVAAAVIATGVSFGNVWASVVAGLVMAGVTWRWWLPIDYEVNAKGFQYQALGRTRSMTWRAVRRYQVRPDAAVLLPTNESTPVDVFRGLVIPFGKHREDVLNVLKHYLGPAEE